MVHMPPLCTVQNANLELPFISVVHTSTRSPQRGRTSVGIREISQESLQYTQVPRDRPEGTMFLDTRQAATAGSGLLSFKYVTK